MRQVLCAVVAVAATWAAAAPAAADQGPLSQVTVDVLEDAQPVRDVLRRLEERHGLNYVVSEQVLARAGTVTVRLRQVPLDTALEAICSAAGLVCEVRGPVITVLAKAPGAQPALPRVDEGLVAERHVPFEDLTGDTAPPLAADDMTAVGRVEEVDLEAQRLQLRIDGTKVDFYLPRGDALQSMRLERALATLKTGSRVALLYRRDGERSVLTAFVGGTRPLRRARPRPAGASRDAARRDTDRPPAEGAPEQAQPELAQPELAQPAQAQPDLRLPRAAGPAPAPEVPPAAEAEVGVPMPEGTLVGRFVDRAGEAVRVRRGDGQVISLQLPPVEEGSDRRERVTAAIDAMQPEGQVVIVYETVGEAKIIVGTITSSR